MIHQEDYSHMEKEMNKVLSSLEKEVLALYLDGQSYQEISFELNRQVKSVDNALQRIKRKLERYMQFDAVR
jgi:RNA polymerase sporulation-specific sigma factor